MALKIHAHMISTSNNILIERSPARDHPRTLDYGFVV